MILAEVADKMPELWFLWAFGVSFGVVLVACFRVSKRMYLPVIPAAGWLANCAWTDFVKDHYFRDAVVREIGWHYVIQTLVATFFPLLALLTVGVCDRKNRRKLQVRALPDGCLP